jgi:hypothetical protein
MAGQVTCDAAIRPFPNATEIRCALPAGHTGDHSGVLHDYAFAGSRTEMFWSGSDRRCFRGDWPGDCGFGCILPLGHRGRCAQ